jgi:predicted O-methyltransferase YrrM
MLGRAALLWLERNIGAGSATLETGAGISTLVFAAAGAEHDVITPAETELERIRFEAAQRGIDVARVRFHVGPSHEVLAELPPRELDLALIDGAHGFPYPVLDWWLLARRLRIGAPLLVDDAFLPPVALLVDHLHNDPAWSVDKVLGDRTVVARKLEATLPPFGWDGERIGGGISHRHLPLIPRARAATRYLLLERGLGRRLRRR